jgi:hypothetical protein
MKDFRKVSGRKSLDNTAGKEKSSQPAMQSTMETDPLYMQKLMGNRAVQFLVESQAFAGAWKRTKANCMTC